MTIEPFIVKHYSSDERPTIKGNGFDGLEIGEDRAEAEEFVSWLNARLAAPTTLPAARTDNPVLYGMELQRDAILQMVKWRLGRLTTQQLCHRVEGLTDTIKELRSLKREIEATPCNPPLTEAQPAAPDWRALCAELLQPLAEYDDANPYREHRDLITRTRAALSTPPAVDGDERLRLVTAGICSGYIAGHEATVEGHYGDPDEVAAEMAPMVLGEVASTPPAATREAGPLPQAGAEISDEEIDQLEASMWEPTGVHEQGQLEQIFNYRAFARAVLSRWGGAAVPVPVSERLPGADDLDENGRCWVYQNERSTTHWLPHWALPVPAAAELEGRADG